MDLIEANARAELADELHTPGTVRALMVRSRIFTSSLSHADCLPEAEAAFPEVDVCEEAIHGFIIAGHWATFDEILRSRLTPICAASAALF